MGCGECRRTRDGSLGQSCQSCQSLRQLLTHRRIHTLLGLVQSLGLRVPLCGEPHVASKLNSEALRASGALQDDLEQVELEDVLTPSGLFPLSFLRVHHGSLYTSGSVRINQEPIENALG